MKKQDMAILIENMGGKMTSVGVLPDGSGFATASFPLLDTHWLYAKNDNIPPMPMRSGIDHPRYAELHDMIREAARYAVRCATMNGIIKDFDPDALVQNMLVGLLGYHTSDGLSSERWHNPDPVPPIWDSDPLDLAVRLANAAQLGDTDRAALANMIEHNTAREREVGE